MLIFKKKKDIINNKIVSYLRSQGAILIKIFGSYSRGDHNKKSDIDIIAKFSNVKSLLELVRIERELSELIGIKVDLLTENSISPLILKKISGEQITLYEQY